MRDWMESKKYKITLDTTDQMQWALQRQKG